MLQTIEAIVEENGTVRLLESVHPTHKVKALLTFLEPVGTSSEVQRFLDKPTLWQALQTFRASTNFEGLDIDTSLFDEYRKQQKERDIQL